MGIVQKATSIWQLLQPLEKCKCQVHMECDKKVNSARQTTKRHQGPFVQTSTWLKRQDANNTCLHITSWKRTQDGAQVFNMLRSLNWLIMAAFASIEISDRITEVLTYILSVNNQELKITGRMWHCLDTIGNHTCQGNILCVHRFLRHDIAYNTGKLGLHRCSRRTKEKPELRTMTTLCRLSFWVVHRGSGGGGFPKDQKLWTSSFINARCSHWIALLMYWPS